MQTEYSRTNLSGTCGVGLIHAFYRPLGREARNSEPTGGVGLHCAGYVSTKECKEVYNEQHSKYKIVYQSTPRLNNNSGRKFMFVVYDRKVPVSEGMNKDFKFPFRPRSY